MNQLEEIKKLYAKTKTYKIPKETEKGQEQIEVEITPFGIDEMSYFDIDESASTKDIVASTMKMIAKALGLKEEDIKGISFEYMMDLNDAIMDANNFNKLTQSKGVKDILEKRRKQMGEKEVDGSSDIKTKE